MTAWHCEQAWLGGDSAAADVLLETDGDRITAVTPGAPCPPGAHPAARADPARAGRRALARLPPGAARAGAGAGQLLDLARPRCTPSPTGSTRTATSHWPPRRTPRWRWPGSPASASSTTCTTAPAACRTTTRTSSAPSLVEAARRAGVRLTLLDTCYLQGGFDAPLAGPQLRFGDGSVDGWAARADALEDARRRTRRGGRALRARGPGRRAAGGRGLGGPPRRPAARAPVGAAGRERRLPRRDRPHPGAAAGRRGCPRARGPRSSTPPT